MKIEIIASTVLIILFTTLLVPTSTVFAQVGRPTVFGELAFGDTQKQARLTVLEGKLFSVPMVNLGAEALSPKGDVDVRIDDTGLDLIFFFNRSGLYRMDGSGEVVSADQFDTKLRSRVETLQSTVEARLGAPSYTRRQDREDVDAGAFKTVAYWSSDDLEESREIWVGITGNEDGYQPTLIIQGPKWTDGEPLESVTEDVPSLTPESASELL